MKNPNHLQILKKSKPRKQKVNPYLHKNGKPTLLSLVLTHRRPLIIGGISLLTLFWASDGFAATAGTANLEASLDKVKTLVTGKVAATGFAIVTIFGGIRAAMQGNMGLAISGIGIGIGTVAYLEYITKAFGGE
jgi:lipid A disaccharide synthetase